MTDKIIKEDSWDYLLKERLNKLSLINRLTISTYDETIQQVIALDELSEVQKSITKLIRLDYERVSGDGDHDPRFNSSRYDLIEELSDVIICINQLRQIYDIESDELGAMLDKKLIRNLTRLTGNHIGSVDSVYYSNDMSKLLLDVKLYTNSLHKDDSDLQFNNTDKEVASFHSVYLTKFNNFINVLNKDGCIITFMRPDEYIVKVKSSSDKSDNYVDFNKFKYELDK